MIKVVVGNNMSRKSIIIDENTTLRATLEAQQINYAVGMTSLDGCTLNPGDLDKTFADMGVTDHCYLMVVVKADNAVEAKVLGGNLVIISDYTPDQLATVAKYRPDALKLFSGEGKDKEEKFVVSIGSGRGSIGQYGATWSKMTDSNGKATINIEIPTGTEKPKAWAEEMLGVSILNLKKVEEGLAGSLEEINAEKAAVAAAITIA